MTHKNNNSTTREWLYRRLRSALRLAVVGVAALAVGPLLGQQGTAWGQQGAAGFPEDWSHHHLVFSHPGTFADAMKNGTFEKWHRISNDPRYQMQQMKRDAMRRALAAAPDLAARMAILSGAGTDAVTANAMRPRKQALKRDWNMNLGGSAKVGAARFPAKYSFITTSVGNCSNATTPDYVVYNTGVAGSNSGTKQANIIAYDNIYSGCSGTVPTIYWSYYTGTGSVVTDIVLSGDGTKVAFIESPSSGAATLRILKWVKGQGTDFSAPVAPSNLYTNTNAGNGGNTAWSTCPSGASCMISVAFQSPHANRDTTSSPFYDYTNDALYVGDSGGYLHKFTGVFNGTPGEITGGGSGSGWPQLMSSSNPLASPVYDSVSGNVFIGPTGSGGGQNFHRIPAGGGSSNIASNNLLWNAGSTGFTNSPIVDSSAGTVYVFVNADTAATPKAGVYQLPVGFANGSAAPADAAVGTGSLGGSLYSGTFDNAYFTSTAASPTGHLWVCGNSGGNPTLYPISITSGTMATGAITAGPVVSATATPCSPVTEFCTNSGSACTSSAGTDYIFVSPQTEPASGQVSGCTASEGCVIAYSLNTSGSTATLKGAGPFPGGASGMIVDTQNTTTPGTLQLYFGILSTQSCTGAGGAGTGTGGCAIQASQTAP